MNNYKQCLLFVGKCLTLDFHPERIEEVKKAINNKTVNWENVVRLSSGQYVLPALYLSLKRNGLIKDLPVDLVEYFEEITGLNRERNKAMLDQINDISTVLNKHEIYPVFLKVFAPIVI